MARRKFVPLRSTPRTRQRLIQMNHQLRTHAARVDELEKAVKEGPVSKGVRNMMRHRKKRLASRGAIMAEELRRDHVKGTKEFLSLCNPAGEPLPQVVFNRASWLACTSGQKELKLTTREKANKWKQKLVRFWGWKEGFGKIGEVVWEGDCVVRAKAVAGGLNKLVDQEEFEFWVQQKKVVFPDEDSMWERYCVEKLHLHTGPFVLVQCKLVWPPERAEHIMAMRDFLPRASRVERNERL